MPFIAVNPLLDRLAFEPFLELGTLWIYTDVLPQLDMGDGVSAGAPQVLIHPARANAQIRRQFSNNPQLPQ